MNRRDSEWKEQIHTKHNNTYTLNSSTKRNPSSHKRNTTNPTSFSLPSSSLFPSFLSSSFQFNDLSDRKHHNLFASSAFFLFSSLTHSFFFFFYWENQGRRKTLSVRIHTYIYGSFCLPLINWFSLSMNEWSCNMTMGEASLSVSSVPFDRAVEQVCLLFSSLSFSFTPFQKWCWLISASLFIILL